MSQGHWYEETEKQTRDPEIVFSWWVFQVRRILADRGLTPVDGAILRTLYNDHFPPASAMVELRKRGYTHRKDGVIELQDIVYHNFSGESGIPIRVLEFREKTVHWRDEPVKQARCEGALGWGFEPEWYALQNLTFIPNLRGHREES